MQPGADEGDLLLGAVAEVAVENAHDLLAAYADGTVRYLNHAGSAVIIDGPDIERLSEPVREWLALAQKLAKVVGVWDEAQLPVLPASHTRIAMLTPGGIRFGQGPDDQLRADPSAAAFLGTATQVLLAVVKMASPN